MNVSGQIMLNATYMHNQMTYLWQGPQITACKMHIYYFTAQTAQRRTKLVDPRVQQAHLGRAQCVEPWVFPLGFGDRVWGVMRGRAAGSQHLEPSCWAPQTLPSCSLARCVLIGGLQTSEIQLCPRNPCPSALFNLHCLPKERGAGQDPDIQHSPSHFIHSALPVPWHYEFVVNAEYVMQKYQQWNFLFLDKFFWENSELLYFLQAASPSFISSARLTQTIAFTLGSLCSLGALRSPGGWSALHQSKRKHIQRKKHTWQLFLVFFLLASPNTADISGKSPAISILRGSNNGRKCLQGLYIYAYIHINKYILCICIIQLYIYTHTHTHTKFNTAIISWGYSKPAF